MIKETMFLMGGFHVPDFFPSMGWVNVVTGFRERLRKNHKEFDDFLDEVIAEHRDKGFKGEEHIDLVDVLLQLQTNKDTEVPLSTANIKAVILSRKNPVGGSVWNRLNMPEYGVNCQGVGEPPRRRPPRVV
ncbi:hypothetical protein AMTR_s00028p00116770 [Amborella trichopoda]|uniref:Cytochrome P450 n=1 Tax=Amborella trichopoda TaxID=13333 RepID=W1PKP3_AMBTC|nr:hypothetical protein AMTR_s00028p00116770 [Amborella trichopoda]